EPTRHEGADSLVPAWSADAAGLPRTSDRRLVALLLRQRAHGAAPVADVCRRPVLDQGHAVVGLRSRHATPGRPGSDDAPAAVGSRLRPGVVDHRALALAGVLQPDA